MRMRTSLVLLKTGEQQLTRRLAPHAARARHDNLHFEFVLVCFPSQISSNIIFIFIYRGLEGLRFLRGGR